MKDQDYITIARSVCEQEGWPWIEPVRIQKGFLSWTVVTNAESIGQNARIVIRSFDGQVTKKTFSPR